MNGMELSQNPLGSTAELWLDRTVFVEITATNAGTKVGAVHIYGHRVGQLLESLEVEERISFPSGVLAEVILRGRRAAHYLAALCGSEGGCWHLVWGDDSEPNAIDPDAPTVASVMLLATKFIDERAHLQ